MRAIAGIGVLAQLNEDESSLGDNGVEDYIVVDYSLFAELNDARRIQTVAVYQEGGPRDGWGPLEARPIERQLSSARVREMANLRIGPNGQLRHAWKGITARLELMGLTASIDELFEAPFRIELDPRLEEALA